MVCDLWLVDLDPFGQVLCVSVFQGSLLVVGIKGVFLSANPKTDFWS